MSTFYTDGHRTLSDLLRLASADAGATLLIPDLQRPYVWEPLNVIRLVDSLLRGWPFGSLLLWAVDKGGLAQIPHRSFASLVDRINDTATQVKQREEPATYELVLDGQQRVQSLLLAFGGDNWGFKMLDREWHEKVNEKRQRGPRGKPHWSIGELCLDAYAFEAELARRSNRLREVDYTTGVLRWVVRNPQTQRSNFSRPKTFEDPLPTADSSANKGRYIRLSRLWEKAGDSSLIEGVDFENATTLLLRSHEIQDARARAIQRPMEDLLRKLKEVRSERVTFLQVVSHKPEMGPIDGYMNAVVNIFTRLNSAGRTLTQEEITFAWVKSGWDASKVGDRNATLCFTDLLTQLSKAGVTMGLDELMSCVAFVWATSRNGGKVLAQGDLLVADKINPMSKQLSEVWNTLAESVVATTEYLTQVRGLQQGKQFLSFNALATIWAWRFTGDEWSAAHGLKAMANDGWEKAMNTSLGRYGERWLICSHWAGRWGSASATYVSSCASQLAKLKASTESVADSAKAAREFNAFFEERMSELEADAHDFVDRLRVDEREQVRAYYTPLWIWHRLDAERWKQSAIALRLGAKLPELDVDHTVAVKLWEDQWSKYQGHTLTDEEREELVDSVNHIGNCILLETAFNISKGKKSLGTWLSETHEFKQGQVSESDWANALLLDVVCLRPEITSPDKVAEAIGRRTDAIRIELKKFVSCKLDRTDC